MLNCDVVWCDVELEKLWYVKGEAEQDDWNDISEYPAPVPRGPDGVVVLYWLGDGQVPLQGQHQGHQGRTAQVGVLDGVQDTGVGPHGEVCLVQKGREELLPEKKKEVIDKIVYETCVFV